jgi:hypothetical protein
MYLVLSLFEDLTKMMMELTRAFEDTVVPSIFLTPIPLSKERTAPSAAV